jgi:hypothetical protein
MAALLAIAADGFSAEQTTQPWLKSAAYATASAHDPQFDNRELWPQWATKTDFIKEQWPKARVLVWAHAGKNLRSRDLDLSDAANWLEDGKPATQGPDENTDIVFPASEKRYGVSDGIGCSARHMTVENGCRGWLKSIKVSGNVWIKAGGSWHGIQPKGPKNTFMRNDGPDNMADNKIALNKPPGNSIEWMGIWSMGDELDLFSGSFIVAPDSTFMPGDRSTQHIYPNARLVLTSGASFHKRANQYSMTDMDIVGKLMAGTPERPLTRDCTLALSFKAKDAIKHSAFKTTDRGLIVYKDGRVEVHSADPAKAKLVFRWVNLPVISGGDLVPKDVREMPHGIDMLIIGQVQFDGVEFRDVLKGGILMPDPQVRKQWKNVTFGKNYAQPDELFAAYTGSTDITMKDDGIAGELIKSKKMDEKKPPASSKPN